MLPPLITPVRGVPWGRFRPPVSKLRVDFTQPRDEQVPFQRRPPLRSPLGLPWQAGHVVPVPTHAVTPPAAKVGDDSGFLPRRMGPPVGRVPWLLRNLIVSPPGGRAPPPPPSPGPVLPPGAVGQAPLVAPWPDAPERARRFVASVGSAINALVTAGFLVQTTPDTFVLVSSPGSVGGASGVTADGRVPGHYSV